MSDLKITKTHLVAGTWHGVLTGAPGQVNAPMLEAYHLEMPLGTVSLAPDPANDGAYLVSVGIPADIICDGVQTILIRDADTSETLESIALIAGTPLDDDIRAEVNLLREELDMMKKAFRRHCLETE